MKVPSIGFFGLVLVASFPHPAVAGNVTWSLKDSVAACPAGDSLKQNPRPSALRIVVTYLSSSGAPKVGVPPDSILVTLTTSGGNAKANDKSFNVAADDSTNANGVARFTINGLSGCGLLGVSLLVSGELQGVKFAKVRTTDHDADGRITAADLAFGVQCDLNFDGSSNVTDLSYVSAHRDHWHRNALHGTPVNRTNFVHTAGASKVYWSPNGRWLSVTSFHPTCKVFLVPSDTKDGNQTQQFTFADPDSADYDPSWSPLGYEITFGRTDVVIYRKGIPGIAADTATRRVTFHDDGSAQHRGDVMGAVSPDGQWVVISRRTVPNGPFELFKIPINGDSTQTTKLTSHGAQGPADHYPQWSPDGEWIVFQRQLLSQTAFKIYKIRANGSDNFNATLVYDPGSTGGQQTAANPAYSPDGKVVVVAKGPQASSVDRITNTIDPTLGTPKAVVNYPAFPDVYGETDPFLMPMLSPDGTRIAFRSNGQQIWATRRNMSLPPRITSMAGQALADSATIVTIPAGAGVISTAYLLSEDQEKDPITCGAYLLKPWMAFDPANCRLTLQPPQSAVGKTFYIVLWVTTPSGGTDEVIGIIPVQSGSLHGPAASRPAADEALAQGLEGFAIPSVGFAGGSTAVDVFDVTGRRVASIRGPSGASLRWDGRDAHGGRVTSGVYLYRASSGTEHRAGKIVVVR